MTISKNTPKFNIENKFETLSNMSDDCIDIDNDSNIVSPEPKPQLIFMKLVDNFSEIIFFLEKSLDSILMKKVNGKFIQIYPADIA